MSIARVDTLETKDKGSSTLSKNEIIRLLEHNISHVRPLFATLMSYSTLENGGCYGHSWISVFLIATDQFKKIFELHKLLLHTMATIYAEVDFLFNQCDDLQKRLHDAKEKKDLIVFDELIKATKLASELQRVTLFKKHNSLELETQKDALKLLPYIDARELTLNTISLDEKQSTKIPVTELMVMQIGKFTISYANKSHLMDIFVPLNNILIDDHVNKPFSLQLNFLDESTRVGHAITIGWSGEEWIISNSNYLPITTTDVSVLVNCITQAFSIKAFTLLMFARTAIQNEMTHIFNKWHARCSDKAISGNLRETMYVAAIEDDFHTVKTLYQEFKTTDKVFFLEKAINHSNVEIAELFIDHIKDLDPSNRMDLSHRLLRICAKDDKWSIFQTVSQATSLNANDVLEKECFRAEPNNLIIKKLIEHKADPFCFQKSEIAELDEKSQPELKETLFDKVIRMAINTGDWSVVKAIKPLAKVDVIKDNLKRIELLDSFVAKYNQKSNGQLLDSYQKLKLELKKNGEYYSNKGVKTLLTLVENLTCHYQKKRFSAGIKTSFTFFRDPEILAEFENTILMNKLFSTFVEQDRYLRQLLYS